MTSNWRRHTQREQEREREREWERATLEHFVVEDGADAAEEAKNEAKEVQVHVVLDVGALGDVLNTMCSVC